FLGKAFSLKESTCAAIASSTPIILIPALNPFEAAAMTLALSGIQRLGGVLEFSTADTGDLPKIDWPRRPQVFKREISDHLEDLQTTVPTPDGSRQPLIDLLIAGLASLAAGEADAPVDDEPSIGIKPAQRPKAAAAPASIPTQQASEFKNMPLPEITPFSNPVVQQRPTAPPMSVAQNQEKDDPTSRLNELFPDEGGFVPNNEDITNILDRLLPDEESASQVGGKPQTQASGRRNAVTNAAPAGPAGGGFSVFLAKIADEARRTKAVGLIAELAKIGNDEAETLSKKVIIPVLKGATKDEAESAKQKFAKIGILARVKGPE
nr:hypothetical protein [Planctomycetota bacterium]